MTLYVLMFYVMSKLHDDGKWCEKSYMLQGVLF